MHGEGEFVSQVIFGWDPLWVSSILFVVTYAAIVSEKVNRAIVAGLSASLMVTLGVLNQETAISGIDFNTLGLFTGMMVIVGITRGSGVFQYVAVWSAKKVKASPWERKKGPSSLSRRVKKRIGLFRMGPIVMK